ncbi:unnamed protein product, partial [Rotaria magnacalcarata]
TVIKLGLAWNKIGDTGAKYLAEALRNNTTLNKLDLWGNEITENGVHYLFEALRYNRVLLELEVGAGIISLNQEKRLKQQDGRIQFSSLCN